MDTKELLKKVRKIEIKTKRLSDHIFGGEYQSTFKGRGMAFSEVRQYQYGDDVRAIDWNVTARNNDTFIKVFEEERELTMMLIIDISGSNFFGSKSIFKNEYVTELAATLAFSATKNNDKVGLILFSDNVELYIPPKKGKSHVLRIIRELLEFKSKSKKTDINVPLKFVSNILKNRSIAFIISDFISKDYSNSLKIFSSKHDVTGIRIYDQTEEIIPNLGVIDINDNETGQINLTTIASGGIADISIIFGQDPIEVTKEYHKIVGTPVLTPMWALGWHQCKWGYKNTNELRDVRN